MGEPQKSLGELFYAANCEASNIPFVLPMPAWGELSEGARRQCERAAQAFVRLLDRRVPTLSPEGSGDE